jgi:hypothetical protein
MIVHITSTHVDIEPSSWKAAVCPDPSRIVFSGPLTSNQMAPWATPLFALQLASPVAQSSLQLEPRQDLCRASMLRTHLRGEPTLSCLAGLWSTYSDLTGLPKVESMALKDQRPTHQQETHSRLMTLPYFHVWCPAPGPS